VKFLIADTFTRSLARLDGQSQSLIKQAAFDFQVHPDNPGFQLHKLDRARDKGFWSFRVNKDLRIIVHRSADALVLCYADHHDPAYAWAESRKLETHPQTGAAQFVAVKERVEEVVRTVVREKAAETPLFAKHAPDYLLSLGVPSEWVDAVRTVGEAGFDKLASHLPAEAAERLLQLACGEPVPRPTKVSTRDPFEHPDAQRRFRVFDSQDELRRALEAPWEQWIVFLHPTQRGVAGRRFNGPARVTGSAGTGKSVVALHRTAHLLRAHPGKRILLTTFSKTLAARLGQLIEHLVRPASPDRGRLSVDHLHKVARDLWTERAGRAFQVADSRVLDELLTVARERVRPRVDFSQPFARSEWDSIVDPWGIRSWPAYKGISRAGRATPLGARQRMGLWAVFEELNRLLEARGLMTWSRLCYEAAALCSKRAPFAHVVADECQDFGPAELTLLRALAPIGEDDLLLCSDAGQRIYRAPVRWSSTGIDVRGRSTRLTVNYRTTDQIRSFADRLLPGAIDEGEGDAEDRSTVSLLQGPSPEVSGFDGISKEIQGVSAWLKQILASGYAPRDIAIFARTEAVLRDRVEVALARIGLAGHALSDEQSPSAHDVSTGTLHRAKGLEFKVVVVMGCDVDLLPLAYAARDLVDDADRDAFEDQERHLLYVACTRARERLFLTHAGKRSRWLSTV